MTHSSSEADRARRALIVWALVARGGSALQNSVKPKLEKLDREALIAAGWLRRVGTTTPIRVELTDDGWIWAATNTGAALPKTGNSGTAVLGDLLVCFGRYLAERQVKLKDFVRPGALPPSPPPPPLILMERIRAAYLAETGGVVNRRAKLAGIRARLAEVERAELDAALVALELSGAGATLPLDDPTEITAADHEAALTAGGKRRHILWLDR